MKQNLLGVDEAVRREVEEVTGFNIPDPNQPEFNTFVQALKKTHPLLAEKLANALIPNVISPYEEAAQQARKRRSIGRIIRNLFYTEDWGEFKLNRRAIMITLLAVVTTTLAASYVVSSGIQKSNEQRRALVEQERLAREDATPTDNPNYDSGTSSELEKEDTRADITVVANEPTQQDTLKQSELDTTTILDSPLETDDTATTLDNSNESGSYYSNDVEENEFAYVGYNENDVSNDPFNEPIFDENLESELNAETTTATTNNDDIPPPTLDGQNDTPFISIPPPNRFTPYDANDVADNNAINTSSSISSYGTTNNSVGENFASFDSSNTVSTFQRDSSSLISTSPLSTRAELKERARVNAYTRSEVEARQGLTTFNNESNTESAALTAFRNESSGLVSSSPISTNAEVRERAGVTSFAREQIDSSQTLTTFRNESDGESATLTTFRNQSDNESATLTAFRNESSGESNQAITTSFRNEAPSLTSTSPLSTNAEVRERVGVNTYIRGQADSNQAITTNIRDESSGSSLTTFSRSNIQNSETHPIGSYQRDSGTGSLTLHNNSSSNSIGTDVLYRRGADLNTNSSNSSGDVLFNRFGTNSSTDANNASGDVLYKRSTDSSTNDANTSDDALFNRLGSDAKATQAPKNTLLNAGDLYPATLITNAVAIDGGEGNYVIAESKDWCNESDCPVIRWVGQTTYNGGRIGIVFNDIVIDNKSSNGVGIAFSIDNSQDLIASVGDSSPTLAADMLRSVAGGVSEFAGALANPTSVTTNGQFAIEQYEPPSIWGFLMGSAADTLKLPDNNETNIIRTAFSEKGTELMILFQDSNNNFFR